MLRSKKKIEIEDSNEHKLVKEYNYTEEVSDIYMYMYKIVRMNIVGALDPSHFRIEVLRSFIGPHIENNANYGLFSNEDGTKFAFFYKNT